MATSPVKNSTGLVTYTIYSDDEAITSLFAPIGIWIRKEVNRIGKAQLEFEITSTNTQAIDESEDDTFAPGNEVRIEAGYNGTESVIFSGIIVSHQLEIAPGGQATLVIGCCDYAYPATLTRTNKVFEEMTDSEVITDILDEYSTLTPDVEETTATHSELIQYCATDWDFILSRADINGFVVVTENKDISIKAPVVDDEPVIDITYGTDLYSFSGNLDAGRQLSGTEAWAWDHTTQEIITVTGNSPTLNTQGDMEANELAEAIGAGTQILPTSSIAGKDMLQNWADARLLKTGLARIRGEVQFQGNAAAIPGCTISLSGLGSRFDGNIYTGWVEHTLREGDWVTTAGIGISPADITENPDVSALPAGGLLPGIRGLHIGKVVALEGDPDNEHRIQLELPLLNGDTNTVWARLATLFTGNETGSYFIPDINEEVIVGFLNSDPCYPVVMGSLHSSGYPPPYALSDDNNIRALVSRSALRIEFNDENNVLTITTPGENTIVLDDGNESIQVTDQHGNNILSNSSGITLESEAAITLKAATTITVEAGTGMDIKATSDLTISGANVEAKAQTGFTAKGNATAELSAAGKTTVKGAIVAIN